MKTAFFGGDPNWGRIACAVGYAGATVNPDKLDLAIGDVLIGKGGMSTGRESEKQAAQSNAARRNFQSRLTLISVVGQRMS